MNELHDFFNLIGSEKKKVDVKNNKIKKEAEVSLSDLFAEMQEEKKRLQSIKEEEEKKKKELIGNVSLDDLFSSLAEEKKKTKSANEQKKKEQEKLKKEAKVFETFLFSEPKPKSVDTTDWKDDYVPGDVESINIIEPEPLQPSPGAEKFEEIVEEEKEEKVQISETIEKSMEILDKLIPEEEKVEDGPDEEIRRLKREMDQLRKMVYETVRTAAAQGGGGEVRMEFLDDVDRNSAKQNGLFLKYDSSLDKWVGSSSGVSTYADVAGIATVSQGLTGSPNIEVGIITATDHVFIGFGAAEITADSTDVTMDSTGFTMDNDANGIKLFDNGDAIFSGIVTATAFVGDGSRLTGIGAGVTTFASLTDVNAGTFDQTRNVVVYEPNAGQFIGTDILGSLRQLISDEVNDGDVIVYSASAGRFIATSPTNVGVRTQLSDLDDVNVTGISANDVLIFNGTDFEFTTPFEIVDRSDSVDDDTLDYGSF